MLKTNEELKASFARYICSGWMEREHNANALIDQMLKKVSNATIAELNQLFKQHYMMESPVDLSATWQYLFNMKAISLWEDIDQAASNYYMVMLSNFQMADENQWENSNVTHLEQLPIPEQAAVMKELEINNGFLKKEFFEGMTARYPEISELYCLYLDCAMADGDMEAARTCIEKMQKYYPEDYELLKKKLDIFSKDGNKEELHEFAGQVLDYAKKHDMKVAYDLLHYTGQTQIAVKDYDGAVETYSWLITNNSRLDPKNDRELNSLFSLFFEVFGLPTGSLQDQITLIAIQFNFFLSIVKKAGVDCDAEENAAMIGNCVVRLSDKIGNPRYREAFLLILDYMDEEGFLQEPSFKTIITSGYASAENYVMTTDKSIPDDVKAALLSLYSVINEQKPMIETDAWTLQRYYMEGPDSRKQSLKNTYPYLYGYMVQAMREITKVVKKRNPYSEVGAKPMVRAEKKIGRNDPCPCGSGKKYKKCCGK